MHKQISSWRRLAGAALVTLTAAACSIQIDQTTPRPTSAPTTATTVPATVPPDATVTPTAAPAAPPWADLNLNGALIYTQSVDGVVKLDLATGATTALLPPIERSWLSAATVSPDGSTIVLAYAPPPQGNEVQLGYTGLYQIPADGSAVTPEPVLERVDPQESYFLPAFTPDGRYLYFGHFIPVRDDSGNSFKYNIERIEYPGGEPELILENAIWPRPSPDGETLAYLKFDAETFTQELYLADLDGQNTRAVLPADEFPSVDAHFFSPDAGTLIFNAVGEGQSPGASVVFAHPLRSASGAGGRAGTVEGPPPALSWFDRLMGVRPAAAHTVPSDWWSIKLGETTPVRLTELYDTGMYGDFSDDGGRVGFISASGIYVMNPDGSEITPLTNIDALGTLEWVP